MGTRRGFTLIELLVVIAIIAILAAMLFPVFARARESARKIQCLSNIKNIAIAFQMYLTDYDRFPPQEHRPEVLAFFSTSPGASAASVCPDSPNNRVNGCNPFLHWPVVLDEYIKNRDVWRCASAKLVTGARYILPSDWFADMVAHQGQWGHSALGILCSEYVFPPGWGGTITDSLVQQASTSPDVGGFEQEIGTGEQMNLDEVKTSQFGDPTSLVVCADSLGPSYASPSWIIFPDNCMTQCGSQDSGCCNDSSGDPYVPPELKHTIWQAGTEMGKRTRHLGGSNLGFADGHASWMSGGAILSASKYAAGGVVHNAEPTVRISLSNDSAWVGCLCEYSY
jgi:prepilin-type N-terminal cleavage/methylation domain-containing protein/prepilin-type processing-associated H-X9-DG protein